jgi:murein DD-endopeptidase MepM/ murein hydrolase activator NlpD
MQRKAVAIFISGFAVGALSVTLGMVASRTLQMAAAPAPPAAQGMPGPEIPPPSLADFGQPTPRPALAPPPQSSSFASGEADRVATEALPKLGMPLAGIAPERLTDTFNEARDGRKHEALDIPAPRGTPVVAVAEGNVAKLFTSKLGGLTVYQFDDSGAWCYYYAHLDHYAPALKQGMLLRKGDTLGYVGTTGDAAASAPHLHFAVFRLGPEKQWWKGSPVDPLPLLK